MDDFRLIYRILNILRKSMDLEEFDAYRITASALGISEPKWSRLDRNGGTEKERRK